MFEEFFDPDFECFAEYGAFCSHIFDYFRCAIFAHFRLFSHIFDACLRRKAQNYGKIEEVRKNYGRIEITEESKRFEIMEKLYTSKTFLKMAGGRMHTPHPTPHGSAPGHKLQKP